MANKLDPMDLKQIITLHLDGYSNRKIASTLSISRNTVNTYMQLFAASEYSFKELLSFETLQLSELFSSFTTVDIQRHNELMLYFETVNKARNHPGFTFLYHYNQYADSVVNPYSYTQFMEHYNRNYKQVKGSMKLEHEPGKEMYIDFAGKKLSYVDKQTGEIIPVEVFVSILPNSQYTYVQVCASQKKEDLIQCCTNALHFYGGVPLAVVSDNLKSAVSRSSKYEAQINRSFKDFASHYGCVVNPTRAYSPQDKALVENAVHLVYQRIYYPIRDMTFFSLEELNQEIQTRLVHYNQLLFQRKEASRVELFQSVERQYLKPLPCTSYQIKDYTRAKVQKIGYVYFSPDKSYYSVPFRYIGHQTTIHYTNTSVEVYYNHLRIALHKRSFAKGIYTTEKEHLSSTHQYYTNWSPEFFKKQAQVHGDNVVDCVERILDNVEYPEIGYKRVMGLIQLSKSYGSQRLDNACKLALKENIATYTHIKNILHHKMDLNQETIQQLNANTPHIPSHTNIRGASSYQ
ncbi:LuxR family transcriptional regulator [Myroides marinus]|uniref:IS21 family transposase n=1 Tax=Myroides marinus TaxID=703342 RepID=UPI000741D5A2|nr:IS21 family transposase [Myroides marinus]KUF41312.1 LuxR family transcriptional regulator [Myroides marinus]MDM1405989.1 IS21 family transposase [Myroides marinus]